MQSMNRAKKLWSYNSFKPTTGVGLRRLGQAPAPASGKFGGWAHGYTAYMMNNDLSYLSIDIAVGFGATFVMDMWTLFVSRAFNIPSPNYCLVGRWLRYMPDGVFRHSNITATPKKPAECIVGWTAHYVIGAIYALSLVLVTSHQWLREATLAPAIILGVATVAIPFLTMQPAFGLGVASSKTPNPTQARLQSLTNHTVFGLGLYLSAVAIRMVFNAYA